MWEYKAVGLYSYETFQLRYYVAAVGLYHNCGTLQLWEYTAVGLFKLWDYTAVGIYSCETIKLWDYKAVGI